VVIAASGVVGSSRSTVQFGGMFGVGRSSPRGASSGKALAFPWAIFADLHLCIRIISS